MVAAKGQSKLLHSYFGRRGKRINYVGRKFKTCNLHSNGMLALFTTKSVG